MMRIYWGEIARELPIPEFGGEFGTHMAQKKHPDAHDASLSAWTLLKQLLQNSGYDALPDVYFSDTGKPYFADCSLYFSLSHSGLLAAAIVSDAPCAVDMEIIRPHTADRLTQRCLSEREIAKGCDFFDVWTKKECIAKLDGCGLPGTPGRIDTLDAQYEGRFHLQLILDSLGREYALCALGDEQPATEKRTIG